MKNTNENFNIIQKKKVFILIKTITFMLVNNIVQNHTRYFSNRNIATIFSSMFIEIDHHSSTFFFQNCWIDSSCVSNDPTKEMRSYLGGHWIGHIVTPVLPSSSLGPYTFCEFPSKNKLTFSVCWVWFYLNIGAFISLQYQQILLLMWLS